MKAKPVKLIKGQGYVDCSVEEATHVSLRFPGPAGRITVPITSAARPVAGGWTWDGDMRLPTLRPSFRTSGVSIDNEEKFVCHTWVTDGIAEFLSDSTHSLKNTKQPMLDV